MVMNTFLGTDRHNYDVRGTPCGQHSFQSNVSRQSQSGTISLVWADAHSSAALVV
jgi:hypothetical protein